MFTSVTHPLIACCDIVTSGACCGHLFNDEDEGDADDGTIAGEDSFSHALSGDASGKTD